MQGNYNNDPQFSQPQQHSLGTSRNLSKGILTLSKKNWQSDLKSVSTAEIQKSATIRKQLKEDSRLYDLARGGRLHIW